MFGEAILGALTVNIIKDIIDSSKENKSDWKEIKYFNGNLCLVWRNNIYAEGDDDGGGGGPMTRGPMACSFILQAFSRNAASALLDHLATFCSSLQLQLKHPFL